MEMVQHPLDRRLDRPQEQVRQHAHQDGDRDDRYDDHPLARPKIGKVRVLLVRHGTVVHPLEHPEHVGRRQDDAGRRERREARIPAERAEQDQELADEPVQPRQSDRRQGEDQERRHQVRRHVLQPAVLRDLPRVPAVRQHADDEEEAAGADAVAEHLVDGAGHALRVHRGDPEHHEAEMADARVGHQLLHVRLHHRDERAVDDADDGEHGERRREVGRGLREQRERKPHEAIGAHFQHHAGQNHGPRGRRLDVRVWQPGVEREQRYLDRERQREREEEPELRVQRHLHLVQLQQIEAVRAGRRVVHVREAENREQHQHAAGHRVEDELDRGVDAPLVAPDADEEIHRHEHRVPEDVEEEEVERDEDAHHRALEQQHEDAERLGLLVDRLPRAEQRERRQEACQNEQQQADAVDADEVLDAERRDPGVPLDELEVAGRRVELAPEQQRLGEHQQRGDERDVAHQRRAPLFIAVDEEQQDGSSHRQRDERGQNRKMHQRLFNTEDTKDTKVCPFVSTQRHK